MQRLTHATTQQGPFDTYECRAARLRALAEKELASDAMQQARVQRRFDDVIAAITKEIGQGTYIHKPFSWRPELPGARFDPLYVEALAQAKRLLGFDPLGGTPVLDAAIPIAVADSEPTPSSAAPAAAAEASRSEP